MTDSIDYGFGISREKVQRTSLSSSTSRKADDDARSLSSSAEAAKTRVCVRTRAHARDDRERFTREADRIVRSRRVPLHIRTPSGPEALHRGPSPRSPPSRVLSSLYIEIALPPNRTHAFAFHRRRSPGKSFSSFRLCPPHLYGLPVSGPDLRSRDSAEIARTLEA